MADWIGRTFTSTVGWNHLERLVDIGNRMAGSAGEREAAIATRDALSEAGARNAHLDAFEIQGWERGSSTIRAGDSTYHCIALPRSPAESVTGDVVDLGYGLPSDFDADLDGAIVMVSSTVPDWYDRFIHRREKYYRAVQAGVAGFIFTNHVEGCLAPTGSVGTADAPIGDIPAVGVSKEEGARLARQIEDEPVTLTVEASYDETTSQNVHAYLGPDTTGREDEAEEILVTSHVDAHDISEGALDNGMGTAMVVELAAALSTREDDLDTRVHFVVFGAEEVGLCGSEYEANRVGLDRIKAVVNSDGVARGRTIVAHTHGFTELADAVDEVAAQFDHPISKTPQQGPHSDHWPFVRDGGVPGLHLMSETETHDRGRGWGHTSADTLDKLESRTLRESAILITELIVSLAREETTIARRSPEEIIEALERENKAEGMRIIGDLT